MDGEDDETDRFIEYARQIVNDRPKLVQDMLYLILSCRIIESSLTYPDLSLFATSLQACWNTPTHSAQLIVYDTELVSFFITSLDAHPLQATFMFLITDEIPEDMYYWLTRLANY